MLDHQNMKHKALYLYFQGGHGFIAAQTPHRWQIEDQVKHTAAQDNHIAKAVYTVSHSPSHTGILHHSAHPRSKRTTDFQFPKSKLMDLIFVPFSPIPSNPPELTLDKSQIKPLFFFSTTTTLLNHNDFLPIALHRTSVSTNPIPHFVIQSPFRNQRIFMQM